MRIITHESPDMDAAFSVCAAKRYYPGAANTQVVFLPQNVDPGEIAEDDLVLDMDLKGRGIKGDRAADGRQHSCFAWLIANYAPKEDQEILTSLVDYIDTDDAYGSPFHWIGRDLRGLSERDRTMLRETSLKTLFRSLSFAFAGDDAALVRAVGTLLDGFLARGQSYKRAQVEAESVSVQRFGKKGCVAILRDAKEAATSSVLFSKGVRVVVYVDGNDLGLTREAGVTLRMDHEAIKILVKAAGELHEWFAHSTGFLYCRGGRRATFETPSKVNPEELAELVAGLLAMSP